MTTYSSMPPTDRYNAAKLDTNEVAAVAWRPIETACTTECMKYRSSILSHSILIMQICSIKLKNCILVPQESGCKNKNRTHKVLDPTYKAPILALTLRHLLVYVLQFLSFYCQHKWHHLVYSYSLNIAM